jgi:uncharacterized protein (DUF1697 family)
MNRHIILLRAINVGATARLSMDDLREVLTAEGCENVRTYIASGNIVVDTVSDAEAMRIGVNTILNTRFNISGERSIVVDQPTLLRIIKSNPFKETAQHRPQMLQVHFLSSQPSESAELNLTSYKGPERLRLAGQQLYVDYVNGAGTTSLTGRFLESALGATGTGRNWNTVLKLAEMAAAEV